MEGSPDGRIPDANSGRKDVGLRPQGGRTPWWMVEVCPVWRQEMEACGAPWLPSFLAWASAVDMSREVVAQVTK